MDMRVVFVGSAKNHACQSLFTRPAREIQSSDAVELLARNAARAGAFTAPQIDRERASRL
jgi:hypothetical protein